MKLVYNQHVYPSLFTCSKNILIMEKSFNFIALCSNMLTRKYIQFSEWATM